jgi:Cohesin domain.
LWNGLVVRYDSELTKIIDSGNCGNNITWTLYDNDLLDITGTGDMATWQSNINTPWFNYRNLIRTINISEGITSIGQLAFIGFRSLTDVIIPDSIISIGRSAFASCGGLTSINISDSVINIGDTAFDSCTSLTNIRVASGNQYYKDISGVLFDKSGETIITYPAGRSEINYLIPAGVKIIGYGAFNNCTSLTNINIPYSVTSIRNNAFNNCTSLTNINIPDSVMSIGDWAFSNCTGLTNINIPDSIISIGYSAFAYCTSLTNITVASGNQYYKDISGVLFDKSGEIIIKYPEGRSGINYVIPAGVTSIGDVAFDNCTSLTSINIPNSIMSIGGWAFNNCTSLTSINIPDSVTNIGGYAFINCLNLYDIYLPEIPPTMGEYVFSYVQSGARAIVPYGSTAYGAEGTLWNELIVTYAPSTISLPEIEGMKGQQVAIPIDITYNPGLVTFQMNITYDPSVLTPVKVENGAVWNSDIAANLNYTADKISIASSSSSMKTGDGSIAYIVFDIKETAVDGVYPVKLEIDVLETLDDTERQALPFVTIDGSVNIITIIKGDVDLNGTVNAGDATEVLLYTAHLKSLTDKQLYASDTINRGGDKVDASDATRILLRAVGLIPEFSLSVQMPSPEQQPFSASVISSAMNANDTVVSIGSVNGTPGDIVTVPISITNNTGFSTFTYRIDYDNTKLTPISVTSGNVWGNDFTANTEVVENDSGVKYIIITGAASGDTNTDGVIFNIKFKINDNSSSGNANVILNVELLKQIDYSNPPEYLTDLVHTVTQGEITVIVDLNEILDDLNLSNIGSVNAAVDAIKGINIDDLLTAMDNVEILEKLANLDQAYKTLNSITVNVDIHEDLDIDDVTIIVAGLNADPGDTVTLVITSSDKIFIDNGYTNCISLNISLQIDGTEIPLNVPVKITVPVPTGFDPDKFVILHFTNDETFEAITPIINGDGTASFTVTQFSDFIFAELNEVGEQIMYGDVNGDGKVDTKDITLLRQYVADWDVTIDLDAADVNGDGKVDTKDITLLRQYVADWDVTLGPNLNA